MILFNTVIPLYRSVIKFRTFKLKLKGKEMKIPLKLKDATFFFVNSVSVKKTYTVFDVPDEHTKSWITILAGLNDNRIETTVSLSDVIKLANPNSGSSGGTFTGEAIKGDPGESAYQIAVRLGLTTSPTEEDWIRSLTGSSGQDGNDFDFTVNPKDIYEAAKGVTP